MAVFEALNALWAACDEEADIVHTVLYARDREQSDVPAVVAIATVSSKPVSGKFMNAFELSVHVHSRFCSLM
jgi:hypothetical protein